MSLEKPDPILQNASKEIAQIFEKYDIGGYIILASKTHGEYLMHFPKWSKAQLEITDGKPTIRFKAKHEEIGETTAMTVHMIQVFQVGGAHVASGMDRLLEMLENKMWISGGPEKI